ncbi:hypothetical protein AOQ84DRAFT_51445 [Glonium stellatum]|uniref:Uncharacterized protein n=1 Tax=Glonium stellatum TaxID=574774 RepID=A0A8E2F0H5_9PEZI|nr:hypothetical protein AOQ84DRAFT_51445 [Glonium stellatum]
MRSIWWLCLLGIPATSFALVIPDHHRIPSDIARHIRETYEKVYYIIWRIGVQVVSAIQLSRSCITLFRAPHATSIQLSSLKTYHMAFPTLLFCIVTVAFEWDL